MKYTYLLLFSLAFMASCAHHIVPHSSDSVEVARAVASEDQVILAETKRGMDIKYRKLIPDGYSISSCSLRLVTDNRAVSVPKKSLAVVIEIEDREGQRWFPAIYFLAHIKDDGKLAMFDSAGTDVGTAYFKNKGTLYRNSFFKVNNSSGFYEFQFEDASDFSSIKYFKAIQDSGWNEKTLIPTINITKSVEAECKF
jgi:hypothetical protein